MFFKSIPTYAMHHAHAALSRKGGWVDYQINKMKIFLTENTRPRNNTYHIMFQQELSQLGIAF